MKLQYLKFLVVCICAVSCSRTQINFDDPSVPRGAWIGIMGEDANEKRISFNFVVNQECRRDSSGQACDGYTVSGQAVINAKNYTVKGEGSLGLSSPPAVNYGPSFSVDILDNMTIVGRIFNESISLNSTNDAEFNQIPKNGILKKANP